MGQYMFDLHGPTVVGDAVRAHHHGVHLPQAQRYNSNI
jgi:hypothetical protein